MLLLKKFFYYFNINTFHCKNLFWHFTPTLFLYNHSFVLLQFKDKTNFPSFANFPCAGNWTGNMTFSMYCISVSKFFLINNVLDKLHSNKHFRCPNNQIKCTWVIVSKTFFNMTFNTEFNIKPNQWDKQDPSQRL